MKNYLIGFALLCGLSTALGAHAEQNQQDVFNTLKRIQFWGLIQANTLCAEQYNFLPSGEVAISSNAERITGQYSFMQNTQSFALPALIINFKTDNQQPDCLGSSSNQTGTSTTNFLKKVSDQEIYFCHDAWGKDCPVFLRPLHSLKTR